MKTTTRIEYIDATHFMTGVIIARDANYLTIEWADGQIDRWSVNELGAAGALRIIQ